MGHFLRVGDLARVVNLAWGIDPESGHDDFLQHDTRLLVVGSDPKSPEVKVSDGRRTLMVRRRDLQWADI